MTFEQAYNNCYVELRDGKPLIAYDRLADAQRGVFFDKMADATFKDVSFHSYEIKFLKDGVYYDVKEDL